MGYMCWRLLLNEGVERHSLCRTSYLDQHATEGFSTNNDEYHDASHEKLVRLRLNMQNWPVDPLNNHIDNDAVWKLVPPCDDQEKVARTATSRNQLDN